MTMYAIDQEKKELYSKFLALDTVRDLIGFSVSDNYGRIRHALGKPRHQRRRALQQVDRMHGQPHPAAVQERNLQAGDFGHGFQARALGAGVDAMAAVATAFGGQGGDHGLVLRAVAEVRADGAGPETQGQPRCPRQADTDGGRAEAQVGALAAAIVADGVDLRRMPGAEHEEVAVLAGGQVEEPRAGAVGLEVLVDDARRDA